MITDANVHRITETGYEILTRPPAAKKNKKKKKGGAGASAAAAGGDATPDGASTPTEVADGVEDLKVAA